MIGTQDDILALEGNIAKLSPLGATLTDLTDPTIETTAGPNVGVSRSQADTYIRKWIRQHPNNKPGNIMVKVEGRRGAESGWLDPVDVFGSGLLKFILSEA